jgi:hypothetical protein
MAVPDADTRIVGEGMVPDQVGFGEDVHHGLILLATAWLDWTGLDRVNDDGSAPSLPVIVWTGRYATGLTVRPRHS